MKLFVFILTVFFMLTVTLQESLAQAATQPDETKEFIEKFSKPIESFYPQSGAIEAGISAPLEGDHVDPSIGGGGAVTARSNVDRHAVTAPAKSNHDRTVKEAIGSGSKAESER
jgi:hypothetical protein